MCVCSLFQVINNISTGLYVYELTSMDVFTKICMNGNVFILHKALLIITLFCRSIVGAYIVTIGYQLMSV